MNRLAVMREEIKEELLLAEKDIKIIVELSNYGNEYKYAREIAESVIPWAAFV